MYTNKQACRNLCVHACATSLKEWINILMSNSDTSYQCPRNIDAYMHITYENPW